MRCRLALAAVGAAALLAACSQGSPVEPTEPSQSVEPAPTLAPADPPSTQEPTRPTDPEDPDAGGVVDDGPAYSTWPLYSRPLPIAANGFGEIRPTPPSLRNRRYPTVDVLPAPQQNAPFRSSIGPVTPQIRERMGESYSDTCPVPLSDLAYVNVSFRGFDGRAHTGELVIAASEAADVVSVFKALFEVDFPMEEMRLITTADLEAPATGDGNNTAATICREVRGSSAISAHASGIAIDINPFMNPYVKDGLVLPERASAYLDRENRRPGMIFADSVAVREFNRIGWVWGGTWNSLKDYQHFSANGR